MNIKKEKSRLLRMWIMIHQRGFLVLLPSLLLVFGTGCSRPSGYLRPDVDIKEIRQVAILPIDTFVSDRYAGEKIRQALVTELLSHGIRVIEPGEVTRTLVDLQIKSLRTLSIEEIRKIGGKLAVDTVLTGTVSAFEMNKGVRVSYPEVSVHLMLYDADTGNIIGSTWTMSGRPSFSARHFGTEPQTLSEAVREVVREAVNVLF